MTQLERVEITSLVIFDVSWKFSRGNSLWENESYTKGYFHVGNSHLPTDAWVRPHLLL